MTRIELLKSLWDTCKITNPKPVQDAANGVMKSWLTYKQVGDQLFIPAWVIGCLHYRESNFDFETWLANGDPLFDSNGVAIQTVHVPAGLGPSNTWADAALISLQHQGWGAGNLHWDAVNALDNMDRWNGLGPEIYHHDNSNYLWARTNQYKSGMYTSDRTWNQDAVDHRPGCAAIMKALVAVGVEI